MIQRSLRRRMALVASETLRAMPTTLRRNSALGIGSEQPRDEPVQQGLVPDRRLAPAIAAVPESRRPLPTARCRDGEGANRQ